MENKNFDNLARGIGFIAAGMAVGFSLLIGNPFWLCVINGTFYFIVGYFVSRPSKS